MRTNFLQIRQSENALPTLSSFIHTNLKCHNPFPPKPQLISIITKYQNGDAKPL